MTRNSNRRSSIFFECGIRKACPNRSRRSIVRMSFALVVSSRRPMNCSIPGSIYLISIHIPLPDFLKKSKGLIGDKVPGTHYSKRYFCGNISLEYQVRDQHRVDQNKNPPIFRGIFVAFVYMSFPRRRESRIRGKIHHISWIPAFARMTNINSNLS